ncbi:sarcosine oxidase subunit gamma [Nitratireductor kimnyeongensis]|uniref:Sarcosine oxidase subunit gamma n=1 Tax=Nitratireductor kimnyeongensis TaxID=430679 RepID=A0ABW0T7B4_9HYPH|nr:sarcosine oxidase subunit gamma [Nitratireductor kimnyeongensis]QZZ36317.1 sarcosine oxidase subunit gamma [Nitratireductor kimnyeongensis]
MAETITRASALEGRFLHTDGLTLVRAEPASRLSLRAPEAAVKPLSNALGLALPKLPKTSSSKDGRAALWLGPDEWLVIDVNRVNLSGICASVTAFHSAVDVSHRNTAVLVSGPRCEPVLNAGCPQDLSLDAFPVGACSRTVFGKVEIILWRTGHDAFRVETWRSFADYVFMHLEAAARDR